MIPPDADPYFDMSKIWLPAATLVAAVTPNIALIVRASMIEVLESEYVEMARLKGVPEPGSCSATPCRTRSARRSR